MAKVTHGPMISDARCKVGGVVFSRGRGGPYSRAFVFPPEPQTNDQQLVWGIFADVLLRWQTALTDNQRRAWESFAQRFPLSHAISGTRPLSAPQMFVRMNQRSYWVDGVFLDDPPVDLAVTNLTSCMINENHTGPDTLTITASETPGPGEYLCAFATLPISAGITNFRRWLRYVTFFDETVTYPADFYPPWHGKNWYPYGGGAYFNPVLVAGKRIGIQCWIVNSANYAYGSKVEASSITT
jgi:hypothetical protein